MSGQLYEFGVPDRSVKVRDDVFIMNNGLLKEPVHPSYKRKPVTPHSKAYDSKLNLYTGRNLKPNKEEQPPLFDLFKQDTLPDKNYLLNKTMVQAGRYVDTNPNLTRQFEKPIEEVRVGPGINLGYSNENTNRPFHEMYRPNEKNIEELTGKIKPSFGIDRTDGALMTNSTYVPPEFNDLNIDDAIYGLPNGPIISNIFAESCKPVKYINDEILQKDFTGIVVSQDQQAPNVQRTAHANAYLTEPFIQEAQRDTTIDTNQLGEHNLDFGQRIGRTLTQTLGLNKILPALKNSNIIDKTTRSNKKPIVYDNNNAPQPDQLKLKDTQTLFIPMHQKQTNDRFNTLGQTHEPDTFIQPDIKASYTFLQGRQNPNTPISKDSSQIKKQSINVQDTLKLTYNPHISLTAETQHAHSYTNVKPMMNKKTKELTTSSYTGHKSSIALPETFAPLATSQNRIDDKLLVLTGPNQNHKQNTQNILTSPTPQLTLNSKHKQASLALNQQHSNRGSVPEYHIKENYQTPATGSRFSAQPSPKPWPDNSDFRFSPEYSWQVQDPLGMKKNKLKECTTQSNMYRPDPGIFVDPIMKFKKANWK